MHSPLTHRARIIAAPSKHEEPAHDTPATQLSRQAALFQRLREGSRDAASCRMDGENAPAAAPLDPPSLDPYPLGNIDAHWEERRDNAHSDDGDGESDEGGFGDDGESAAEPVFQAHSMPAVAHAPMHLAMQGPARALMHASTHAPTTLPTPAPMRVSTRVPMSMPMPMSMVAPLAPVRATRPPDADTAHAVAAIQAPASAQHDVHRLVESIVAEVTEFCANPVVLQSGNWQITIPIDPTLLPACTLSLALSYFDLTLRFETTDEGSRQLILQHAATLRESLEQVMQSRFEGARSVEINVT
jgi:hypothetical protein